jgi:hypothetical protein
MSKSQTLHTQIQKSYSPIVQRLIYILIFLWIIAGTLLPLVAFFRTQNLLVLPSLAFLILPIYIFFHDKKLLHRQARKGLLFFEVAFITLIMICISLVGLRYMSYPTSTFAPSNLPSTAHPTAASPFRPNPYPRLATSYDGTIVDLQVNLPSQMSLTRMQQNGGQIAGTFNGMHTSAPYTGFLDTSKNIYFTVAGSGGRAPLKFQGSVQKNGALSGNFCAADRNGTCTSAIFGMWNVAPVTERHH